MFALFSPSLTVTEARHVLAARLFGDFNPLSAAGKVPQREMREPYWKASAREI